MTSKFQQDLREAIKHWGTSLAINARSEEEDWKAVESLTSQAVPMKALEGACESHKKTVHSEFCGTREHCEVWEFLQPQYWIDLAEKEND
jgi:hypothetical protein